MIEQSSNFFRVINNNKKTWKFIIIFFNIFTQTYNKNSPLKNYASFRISRIIILIY